MTTRPARLFAVIASQRTGSTLLVRSLDTAPEIFCAGEIFHGGPNVHHAEYNFRHAVLGSRALGRLVDVVWGTQRLQTHLASLREQTGSDVAAVGFKVMASQLRQRRTLLPLLASLGATLFYLHRRDSFATALSRYRAKESGIYHSDRPSRPAEGRSITADVAEFRRHLEQCRSEKETVLSMHARHGGTLLAYEDMTAHWPGFIESIGVALGIPRLTVSKALDKLDADHTGIRITNETELRQLFKRE